MRLLLLPALALLAWTTSGCVHMHMETVIDPDGGGACTVSYAIGREVADAVAALNALGAGPATERLPSLDGLGRDEVARICAAHGVTLVDHRYTGAAAGQRLDLALAFDDVGALSAVLAGLGDGGGGVMRIDANDDGTYTLRTAPAAPEADGEPPAPADRRPPASADEMGRMQRSMPHLGVLMAHLDELDVLMTITVPGDVIHSNAMEVEGRTSIWSVNAANVGHATGGGMDPVIRFAGDGVTIGSRD